MGEVVAKRMDGTLVRSRSWLNRHVAVGGACGAGVSPMGFAVPLRATGSPSIYLSLPPSFSKFGSVTMLQVWLSSARRVLG